MNQDLIWFPFNCVDGWAGIIIVLMVLLFPTVLLLIGYTAVSIVEGFREARLKLAYLSQLLILWKPSISPVLTHYTPPTSSTPTIQPQSSQSSLFEVDDDSPLSHIPPLSPTSLLSWFALRKFYMSCMNPLIFYSAEPALAFPVAIGLFVLVVWFWCWWLIWSMTLSIRKMKEWIVSFNNSNFVNIISINRNLPFHPLCHLYNKGFCWGRCNIGYIWYPLVHVCNRRFVCLDVFNEIIFY